MKFQYKYWAEVYNLEGASNIWGKAQRCVNKFKLTQKIKITKNWTKQAGNHFSWIKKNKIKSKLKPEHSGGTDNSKIRS